MSRQFSLPHAIAMFLLDVPPGPAWGSVQWASDAAAKAVRTKVKFADYPKAATYAGHIVRGQYRQMPCFVEVNSRSTTVRAEADFAWGDPWSDETRFTDDDIIAKFRAISNLPTSVADAVIETLMVANLGSSLSPIFQAMSQRGA